MQIHYASDTIELLHTIKNKKPLVTGRRYLLDLDIEQLRAWGPRIEYRSTPSDHLALKFGGALLNSYYFTSGRMLGSATATGKKSYDFAFDVDYLYTEDYLFARNPDIPLGYGYSIDAELQYKNGAFVADITAIDVLGAVYYSRAPRTSARANSGATHFDDDGYIRYAPVISGTETYAAFVQHLAPRGQLMLRYAGAPVVAQAELFYTAHRTYPMIGIGWNWGTQRETMLTYETTTHAVGFRYSGRRLRADVMSDALRAERVRLLVLNATLDFSL